MLSTRMTDMLHIRHPIMQGGLHNLGVPELAAAVSEAGGLGTINAAQYDTPEAFRTAVQRLRRMTAKPCCVNFSRLPDVSVGDDAMRLFEIAAEEGVPVIETVGGLKPDFAAAVKKLPFVWIHKVPNLTYALKAEAAGVDMVSVAGFECGGHPGREGLGTMTLTRLAASRLSVPVLAAGGIADGAGLAAALALGAEGVVMGTRFVAARECTAHENFKNWIINARETDTVLCMRKHNPMRVADNATARRMLVLEAEDAPREAIMAVGAGAIGKRCYETGDIEGGIFPVGIAAGLIREVNTCREIIENTVAEAEAAICRVEKFKTT